MTFLANPPVYVKSQQEIDSRNFSGEVIADDEVELSTSLHWRRLAHHPASFRAFSTNSRRLKALRSMDGLFIPVDTILVVSFH